MEKEKRNGIITVSITYVLWGILPLFWNLLHEVDSVYILCSRIVWSLVFCTVYLVASGRTGEIREVLRDRKLFGRCALAGIVICVNWGSYIWAVNNGHLLDSTIGNSPGAGYRDRRKLCGVWNAEKIRQASQRSISVHGNVGGHAICTGLYDYYGDSRKRRDSRFERVEASSASHDRDHYSHSPSVICLRGAPDPAVSLGHSHVSESNHPVFDGDLLLS